MALRAELLDAAGTLAAHQSDHTRGTALLEEALALYRDLDNTEGIAAMLVHLGRLACGQGDYARAATLEEQGLALFQKHENRWGITGTLLSLGDVALDQGDLTQAVARFQEAQAQAQAFGADYLTGWAVLNLGRIAYAQGDRGRAQLLLEESLASFQNYGSHEGVAQVLLAWGRLARRQGDTARAAECFTESLALQQEIRNKRDIAYGLEGLAGIAGERRAPVAAARLFGAAEALRETAGMALPPVNRAEYEHNVATVRAQLDRVTFAASWAAGRALTLEQAIAEAERITLETPPGQMAGEAPGQALQPASAAPERLGTLTPRERQVLALLAQGASNRAIADALVIAERTAEIHVSNILGKLGLTSRTQAAAYAVAQGLAAPPDA